jgi:hypothetical protein
MGLESDPDPDPAPAPDSTVSSPYNVAIFGWFNEARTFASLSNLAILSGSLANSSGKTFNATSRPSFVSSARHTSPIPPAPRAAVMR